jgi:hypothetical protein
MSSLIFENHCSRVHILRPSPASSFLKKKELHKAWVWSMHLLLPGFVLLISKCLVIITDVISPR